MGIIFIKITDVKVLYLYKDNAVYIFVSYQAFSKTNYLTNSKVLDILIILNLSKKPFVAIWHNKMLSSK